MEGIGCEAEKQVAAPWIKKNSILFSLGKWYYFLWFYFEEEEVFILSDTE